MQNAHGEAIALDIEWKATQEVKIIDSDSSDDSNSSDDDSDEEDIYDEDDGDDGDDGDDAEDNDENNSVKALHEMKKHKNKVMIVVMLAGPFTDTQKAKALRQFQFDSERACKARRWLSKNHEDFDEIELDKEIRPITTDKSKSIPSTDADVESTMEFKCVQ